MHARTHVHVGRWFNIHTYLTLHSESSTYLNPLFSLSLYPWYLFRFGVSADFFFGLLFTLFVVCTYLNYLRDIPSMLIRSSRHPSRGTCTDLKRLIMLPERGMPNHIGKGIICYDVYVSRIVLSILCISMFVVCVVGGLLVH